MPKKTLAVLCAVLLLAPDALAAALTVSSNADVGVSTLRDALTSAAVDPASTDIVTFSIPAQTLTPATPYAAVSKNLGAGLTITAPATTIISSPGSNVFTFTGSGLFTLTGIRTDGIIALGNHAVLAGSVGLNNGGSITTSGSETVSANVNLSGTGGTLLTGGISTFETYTGALSGSATLTADGGGTLDLTGATNGATGGIMVNNGTTLKVSAASQMGTGTVVLSGGSTLDTTTGITMSQSLNTLGGTIMTNSGATTSLNGSITGGSLVAAGPGTLDLGASSNVGLGFVKITGGVVKVAADSALGTSDLIFGGGSFGGTLDTTTGITLNRNLNLGAPATIKANAGATTSVNGTILGGGVLTFAGPGTLDLRNDTVASLGGVTITGGTVKVSNDNQLGGSLILNGGALDTTTGVTSSRNVTLAGAGAISTNAGATTSLLGTLSGSGLLTAVGGTLDLTGVTNTTTGGTAINGGAIVVSNDNQLGASGGLTLNGGTLVTTTGITSSRAVVLGAGNATLNVAGGQTTTLSGNISGSGGLVKNGAGTLALGGFGTYFGDLTISQGTLIGDNTSLGNLLGTIQLGNAELETIASPVNVNGLVLAGVNSTVNVADPAGTLSVNALSGNGNLVKTGAGTLAVGALGSSGLFLGNIAINAGTLRYNGPAVTVDGTLTGTGMLAQGGTGVLTVNASAFSGAVAVNGGTLQLFGAAANPLGTSALTLNHFGTLAELSAVNPTFANAVDFEAGTIDTAAGRTWTMSGALSGAGGLTKAGAGTLSLTGTSMYAGDTAIGAGVLDLSQTADLSYAGAISGAGTLRHNSANTLTLTGAMSGLTGSLNAAAGTVNLADASNQTYGGAITGSGTVIKSAASTLTLTGDNSGFSGPLEIDGGTLQVSAANQLGTGVLRLAGGTLATTASMTLGNSSVNTGSGSSTVDVANGTALSAGTAFSGTGTINKNGAGTLTLNGATMYAGNTVINAGTLNLAQTADVTYAGTISGAGALALGGSHTVTLTGVNSYTGDTALNGGTLSVSAANQLGGSSNLNFNGGALATTADATLTQNLAFGAGGGSLVVDNARTSLTGALSGSGAVAKAGAGVLSLQGASMYSGDTAISAGTLDFSQSADVTYNGAIGGAGAVSVGAAGHVVTLGGVNDYQGGTTVNAGTLNVAADSALGGAAGGVALNGAAFQAGGTFTTGRAFTLSGGSTLDTNFNALTLNGAIGGTGGLAVLGGGTLSLGAANSYAGGTTVSDGTTLAIGADAALGDAAGALTFANSSTLQLKAALSSARSLIISGAATYDDGGFDSTLSGNTSGTGGFIKAGAGALTMSGANGSLGLTTVAAGTLNLTGSLASAAAVDSGATLTGNGVVGGGLTNSGTVRPSGTLGVNGGFTNGAGGLVSIAAGTSQLVVNGASALDGTLAVTNKPANGSYVVLTSNGGITGTYASITGLQGVSITPVYALDSLTLNIMTSSTFLQTPNLNRNQSGIAAALDLASQNSTADLDAVIARLQSLSPADLARTFDQMSPSGTGAALGGMSFAGSGAHAGAVGQRMVGLREGGADGAQASYFVSRPQPYPGLLLASGPGDTENYPPAAPTASRWGVFASGVGNVGRLDARADASGSTPGYSFSAGGATVGADYRFTDNFVGGVTAGYTDNAATIDGGNGAVQGRAVRYGLYGTLFNEEWHGSLYLGGANDAYDASRNMTALGLTATSKPHAQEFNGDASVGYDQKLGDRLLFSPFAELAYDRVMTGAYAESGAGSMNLSVSRFVLQSQRSTIGAQLSADAKVLGRAVKPYVSLAESHEFENQGRSILAQYATGGAFVTQTADAARDGAAVGAGLRADLGRGVSTKIGYLGDFRPGFRAHTLNGELRLRF